MSVCEGAMNDFGVRSLVAVYQCRLCISSLILRLFITIFQISEEVEV